MLSSLKRLICLAVQWHTGWVWAAMFTVGIAALFANAFALAYFSLGVLTVYSIAAWWSSESLRKKRPTKALLFRADGTKMVDRRAYVRWQAIPPILILFAGLTVFYGIRILQLEKELEALDGWLYPSNESLETACPIRQTGDLVLLMGSNVYASSKFPYPVLKIGCDRVITLDRDDNGRIGVTLSISDKDGKVIVDLDKGRFRVNPNNYFRIDRHGSRSTLSVIDQYRQEVLYLHMANKNVLQMRAAFSHRGEPFRIGSASISIRDSCFGYNGAGAIQLGSCLVRAGYSRRR